MSEKQHSEPHEDMDAAKKHEALYGDQPERRNAYLSREGEERGIADDVIDANVESLTETNPDLPAQVERRLDEREAAEVQAEIRTDAARRFGAGSTAVDADEIADLKHDGSLRPAHSGIEEQEKGATHDSKATKAQAEKVAERTEKPKARKDEA